MLNTFLPVYIGLLIFFVSLLWAVRQMYVHEFRMTDMNFYSHVLESEVNRNNKVKAFHVQMAKQWLKVSEDYRRACIDYSCITAYMFLGTLFMAVGFFIYILVGIKFTITAFIANPLIFVFTIVFFVFGFFFVLSSLLVLLNRYSKPRIEWLRKLLEKDACSLAERIPILKISHLKQWKEIKKIVYEHEWIQDYIKSLPYYKDLERYFGYLNKSYLYDESVTSD